VGIARSETHVFLRIGPWTCCLWIEPDGYYPRIEDVIPKGRESSRWRLDAEDAVFLARILPRLPGDTDSDKPITLDLNGAVCLRARAEGQSRTTEVVLARSEAEGKPVRLCCNRDYLARVLALGFGEMTIFKADAPVVCRDEKRTFLYMPLSSTSALAPAADALRIVSAEGKQTQATQNRNLSQERIPVMSTPEITDTGNGQDNMNGKAHPPAPENGPGAFGAMITEAEALKALLQDAYSRANKLLIAAKRHRKKAHAVQNTLASLRQLQQIGE
jgi:hypothetical protein